MFFAGFFHELRECPNFSFNFNVYIIDPLHFCGIFISDVQLLCNQYKIVGIVGAKMEQAEISEQYQRMLCQQLSFAFNRLIIENRSIIRNLVLQKLTQFIKRDDKLFIKTYEKLLCYRQQEGRRQFPINKDTKMMAIKYLSYFIEKNLLVLHYQDIEESKPHQKAYQSSGLTLQINSWITAFYRVINTNPSDDFEPYKYSVIEIYVKMFLYSNLYSGESIKKLVNTVKYYFKKKRSKISLNLIQKLIENPKLLKKTRNRDKGKVIFKKKFTKPDILWQIVTLIIEDLTNQFENIDQNTSLVQKQQQNERVTEKKEKQAMYCIQLLTQIVNELQMDSYMDQLCRNRKFINIFKYFLATQYKKLVNQQYRSIVINCMLILGQKIALFCIQSMRMCPEQEIFQIILKLGQFIWNLHIQGELKHGKHYLNQSVTNFILAIIQMGGIGSIMQDGRKTSQFKGNYYYLINKFVKPICQSFQQLFFQSYKNMEDSRVFIGSIKDLVYQMRIEQNENLDCLAHLQALEQPVLYQYTRIFYKLSQSFIELKSMVKKIVAKYISIQVFTDIYDQKPAIQIEQFLGMEEMMNQNLIFGLILNAMLSNIFCSYQDWLILMQNLPCKVSEMLAKPNIQKSNEGAILRSLYLINFRLYMDDILNEQTSDGGVIKQIVKVLVNPQLTKERTNTEVLLYIDIVQYYYTHFNYSYESQKEILHSILSSDPNKYILALQMLMIEKYERDVQISLLNYYLIKMNSCLSENKMSKELVCKSAIRIIKILRSSFLNRSEIENMKVKFIEIYRLNQAVCSIFIEIKDHQLKLKPAICTSLPELISHVIRNQNWRDNFSLLLTKQYMQFIYVLHQTYKDKVETYFDLYSAFERLLFELTVQKASFLDVHQLKYIQIEQVLQNICVDLNLQLELHYIHTFCNLLCKQKYFCKYKIYDDSLPEMNPLRLLAHKSVTYLLEYKYKNVEYSVIFILILHQIISKAFQFMDQTCVEGVLEVVFRQANRKNKLLITDTAYLFRGKIYILFVLIIKNRARWVEDYFNQLLYKQVDQNALSGSNDKKIHNLLIEVFCTARNYAPHYDLPFLISNLISLLEFLAIESNNYNLIEGLSTHSKYIHFYIKLLLEATERLFKYELMKSESKEETKFQEYADSDEHIQAELESKYKHIVWLTKQRLNLEEKNKSNTQILEMFVKFYQNLKVVKQKWLEDVQKKLMEINTMKNINKIMEVYGKSQKKNRKIYTLIHQ